MSPGLASTSFNRLCCLLVMVVSPRFVFSSDTLNLSSRNPKSRRFLTIFTSGAKADWWLVSRMGGGIGSSRIAKCIRAWYICYMSNSAIPDKLITISHAASIIGVSPTTLRSWIDKGELQTWVSPGGRVRVMEMDARGFWQRRGRGNDGE